MTGREAASDRVLDVKPTTPERAPRDERPESKSRGMVPGSPTKDASRTPASEFGQKLLAAMSGDRAQSAHNKQNK